MVRYIEIMDGSSPITMKEVKPPHASNSKAEPLEIQSDTENTSGSKVTEELRNGGDTPKKKWKVSSAGVPSKHMPKKQMKHVEPQQAKEWWDKKGKVVAQDIGELSDEELLLGKFLPGSSLGFIWQDIDFNGSLASSSSNPIAKPPNGKTSVSHCEQILTES